MVALCRVFFPAISSHRVSRRSTCGTTTTTKPTTVRKRITITPKNINICNTTTPRKTAVPSTSHVTYDAVPIKRRLGRRDRTVWHTRWIGRNSVLNRCIKSKSKGRLNVFYSVQNEWCPFHLSTLFRRAKLGQSVETRRTRTNWRRSFVRNSIAFSWRANISRISKEFRPRTAWFALVGIEVHEEWKRLVSLPKNRKESRQNTVKTSIIRTNVRNSTSPSRCVDGFETNSVLRLSCVVCGHFIRRTSTSQLLKRRSPHFSCYRCMIWINYKLSYPKLTVSVHQELKSMCFTHRSCLKWGHRQHVLKLCSFIWKRKHYVLFLVCTLHLITSELVYEKNVA